MSDDDLDPYGKDAWRITPAGSAFDIPGSSTGSVRAEGVPKAAPKLTVSTATHFVALVPIVAPPDPNAFCKRCGIRQVYHCTATHSTLRNGETTSIRECHTIAPLALDDGHRVCPMCAQALGIAWPTPPAESTPEQLDESEEEDVTNWE